MVLTSIRASSGVFPVQGRYEPRFKDVFNRFCDSFLEDLELGASVCVIYRDQIVVDLWGGYCEPERKSPWQENTLCCTMSVSKGVTALCTHLLVDRQILSLDAPVAAYWPEFTAGGKQGILLRWVLDHRAGLPVVTDPLWRGAIFDWEAMTGALARQRPVLTPGVEAAYHTRTFGFLLGEVIRRVTGETLGQFLQSTIGKPFGIDFHIGLQNTEIGRCATLQFEDKPRTPAVQTSDLTALASLQMPVQLDYNAEIYRRSEIPSSNGHGNARSVATLYSALIDGKLRGHVLFGEETRRGATKEQHALRDMMLDRVCRQAAGFLLNTPGSFEIGPNASAVGLNGAGGALGFADPPIKLAFGYVPNRLHAPGIIGPSQRAIELVEATYDCIG